MSDSSSSIRKDEASRTSAIFLLNLLEKKIHHLIENPRISARTKNKLLRGSSNSLEQHVSRDM